MTRAPGDRRWVDGRANMKRIIYTKHAEEVLAARGIDKRLVE
ncbi:MAG: hypothetical protein Q8L37_04040 [Candidatus Gottesmanbacteria bacterium]|nr:hypothetical protein [Candidatus Gottesmanbacteria bacterium]